MVRWTATRRDALAFSVVAAVYLALVRRFWFLTDDAYISFRYMRNWAEGHGLRYNLGEHVPAEGYSNFLLVAFGALVHRLGGDVEHVVPIATALCGLVLLGLVFAVLRARFGASPLVAALATGLLGVCTPFCVWSTSGLETMSYALFFFWTFERLVLRREGPAPVQAGLLALALALSRVEGVYWAVLFVPLTAVVGRLRRERYGRRLAVYAAVLLVPWAIYFACRALWFDALVATTVAAKVALGPERLLRGLDYVGIQYLSSPILVAVLPLGFHALRRDRLDSLGATWLLCVGVSVYAAVVGGDFMTFGRLLVPGLALLAVLWGAVLRALCERRGRASALLLGAAGIVLATLPGWNVHVVPEGVRAALHFRLNADDYASELDQWRIQRRRAMLWSARGAALAAIAAPGDSVVLAAIGASGYGSNLFLYDANGFVTPEVARRAARGDLTGVSSPGHDKSVDDLWFLEHGYEPNLIRVKMLGTRWGQGADEDGDALALHVRRLAEALDADGLHQRYVPEFHEVVHPDPTVDERAYLLLARRVPAGTTPERAWETFHANVRRYQATGRVPTVLVDYPVELPLPPFLRRGWTWLEIPAY